MYDTKIERATDFASDDIKVNTSLDTPYNL